MYRSAARGAGPAVDDGAGETGWRGGLGGASTNRVGTGLSDGVRDGCRRALVAQAGVSDSVALSVGATTVARDGYGVESRGSVTGHGRIITSLVSPVKRYGCFACGKHRREMQESEEPHLEGLMRRNGGSLIGRIERV